MKTWSRRRTALAGAAALAVVCVGAVTVAWTTHPDESDDPLATPWREWTSRDAACPVTLPTSPDGYPKALRDQEGKTTWYGDDRLWVDLSGFYDAALVDDAVRADHAWWTVGPSGEATLEGGPPTVRATRLDGPGNEVATVRGHSDDRFAWWSTRLTFPAQGCWLVTGELGDRVVRVVVRAG